MLHGQLSALFYIPPYIHTFHQLSLQFGSFLWALALSRMHSSKYYCTLIGSPSMPFTYSPNFKCDAGHWWDFYQWQNLHQCFLLNPKSSRYTLLTVLALVGRHKYYNFTARGGWGIQQTLWLMSCFNMFKKWTKATDQNLEPELICRISPLIT